LVKVLVALVVRQVAVVVREGHAALRGFPVAAEAPAVTMVVVEAAARLG